MTLEEALDKILDLEDKLSSAITETENHKTQVAELESRVSSLQEHNQSLFLRCTAAAEEETEQEVEEKYNTDSISKLLIGGNKK